MRLGVIGFGVVGKAYTEAFRQYHEIVYVHDVKDISPEHNHTLETLKRNCQAIFICVPTPSNLAGSANLNYVEAAVKELGDPSTENKPLLIIKSTVPPNTTMQLQMKYPQWRFTCNPEFLRQHTAFEDTMAPDRIILGAFNGQDMDVLIQIYERWNCKTILCSPIEAECIKYLSNAYLTAKVAFACEIGKVCSVYGAYSGIVYEGVALDKRIGYSHLNPQLGPLKISSPCLPKDLLALIKSLESNGYESNLLKQIWKDGVEKINGK
jgi:UDPglucose 6-dehydrogenase